MIENAKERLQKEERHLSVTLDEKKRILILEPKAVLTKDDFVYLATILDPYLAKGHTLKGLMIKTKNFPGWDSLSAMQEHLGFIRQHHEKIDKLAFVTDSSFIDAAKTIAGVFVHPKIKEFNYDASDEALAWLLPN